MKQYKIPDVTILATRHAWIHTRTIRKCQIAIPTNDDRLSEAQDERANQCHHDNVVRSHMLRVDLSLRLQVLVAGQPT